jgi:hypothetical protein
MCMYAVCLLCRGKRSVLLTPWERQEMCMYVVRLSVGQGEEVCAADPLGEAGDGHQGLRDSGFTLCPQFLRRETQVKIPDI